MVHLTFLLRPRRLSFLKPVVCADTVGGKLARKFGALRQTVEQTLGISTGRTEPDVNFDDEDLTLRGQQKCSALIKVGSHLPT